MRKALFYFSIPLEEQHVEAIINGMFKHLNNLSFPEAPFPNAPGNCYKVWKEMERLYRLDLLGDDYTPRHVAASNFGAALLNEPLFDSRNKNRYNILFSTKCCLFVLLKGRRSEWSISREFKDSYEDLEKYLSANHSDSSRDSTIKPVDLITYAKKLQSLCDTYV